MMAIMNWNLKQRLAMKKLGLIGLSELESLNCAGHVGARAKSLTLTVQNGIKMLLLILVILLTSACTSAPKIVQKSQCDWLCAAAIENARARGLTSQGDTVQMITHETVRGSPTGRVLRTTVR